MYQILYNAKNVTKNFEPLLISLEYKDTLRGYAGDICIELADHDRKFMGEWRPTVNDDLEISIHNQKIGKFWIDEVNHRGSRNGFFTTLRALSLRNEILNQTKNKTGNNQVSLSDLAQKLAKELNLTLLGNPKGIIYDNSNQSNLGFLYAQAQKNGYILKIDSGKMVFTKFEDIQNSKALNISLLDCISYTINDKAHGKYASCECRHYDPETQKLYFGEFHSNTYNGAKAVIWEKVSSNNEAAQRAKDWLIEKSKQAADVELDLVGDIRLFAGAHIQLTNANSYNTNYTIEEATHRIDRNGYFTSIKLIRL
jgi:hypothetical protein